MKLIQRKNTRSDHVSYASCFVVRVDSDPGWSVGMVRDGIKCQVRDLVQCAQRSLSKVVVASECQRNEQNL